MKKQFIFHFFTSNEKGCSIVKTVRMTEDFDFKTMQSVTLQIDNETKIFEVENTSFEVMKQDLLADYEDLKIYFVEVKELVNEKAKTEIQP